MNVRYGNNPFANTSKKVNISRANRKNFEKFGNGTVRNDPRSSQSNAVRKEVKEQNER